MSRVLQVSCVDHPAQAITPSLPLTYFIALKLKKTDGQHDFLPTEKEPYQMKRN